MNLTNLKLLAVVFSSTISVLIFFLILDFSFGYQLNFTNTPVDQVEELPYLSSDSGWYELKKNFKGKDIYGNITFNLETDKFGFRKSLNSAEESKYDVIFLGDSFTYGINGPWEETFVGMYAAQSGKKVINAGVSSYSPTPYLYQYKKALKEGILANKHTVIIGIDISDVQDEAAFWNWDEANQDHPVKIKINNKEVEEKKDVTLRSKFRNYLPLTVKIYRYVRFKLFNFNDVNSVTKLTEMRRSAFTWEDWSILDKTTPYDNPSGYAPLGVKKGLEKVTEKIIKINNKAKENNSIIYFLIYPWPAQIIKKDNFNWSNYVQDLCNLTKCSGVVDTIPHFRKIAVENDRWLTDYYISGDIHFNKQGNQVIAEHLFNEILR